MLADDVASNKAIGSYGARFIQNQQKDPTKLSVLTHCNTGRYPMRFTVCFVHGPIFFLQNTFSFDW